MPRNVRLMFTVMLVSLLLAGCNIQTDAPMPTAILPLPTKPEVSSTPTQIATTLPSVTPKVTPTQIPTAASLDCNADKLLANLKSLIPYKEFEVNYSNFSIIDVSALNVWFVDPQIEPSAKGRDIEKNAALAIHNAAILSHKLVNSDKCIAKLFKNGINPVVVDRNYNGWFAGMISISSLPSTRNPSDKDLKAVEDAFKTQYLRKVPTQPVTSASNGSCTWPELHANIQRHFSTEQPNTSFYLVHDEGGVVVYAQWVVPSGFNDKTTFAFSVASVQNVLVELSCLHPPVDVLVATGVDNTGDLKFLGRMKHDDIQKQDIEKLQVLYP